MVCVSLLGLAGMPSVAYCAEEEGGPSIRELEEFAAVEQEAPATVEEQIARAEASLAEGKPYAAQEIIDRLDEQQLTEEQAGQAARIAQEAGEAIAEREAEMAAEIVAAEPAEEEAKKAEALQKELSLKWKVEQQARKVKAAELVDLGEYLLHYESKPREAYELAKKAAELDPENKDALDLKTLAGLRAGVPEEERRFEADKMYMLPRAREQSARQALENALAKGRNLYREGKYQQALEQLRSARVITESLAAYMDVRSQRREVESLLQAVGQDYEEHQRKLAARRRVEAAEQAEEWAERRTEEERKKRSRMVEEINDLIEQKEFDAARAMVDDIEMDDPSDELAPKLRQRIAEERNDYLIDKSNAARRRGDLQWEVWEAEREVVPEHYLDYPDKRFWNEVVEERVSPLYPSVRAIREMPEMDQKVYAELDEVYEFTFEETPLPLVVEYFEEVTPVPFLLFRQDLPPDQAPVSFIHKTTLENALDQITELTGMDWKVDGGMIKIGAPESLRELEARVYPIRDLLLSLQDTGEAGAAAAGGAGGGGGGAGAGGGGGGGGFGPQFAAVSEDVAPQFGPAAAGAAPGAPGAGAEEALGMRTQYLVGLLNQLCGEEPWADFSQGVPAAEGAPGAPGAQAPGAAGGFGPMGPPGGAAGGFGFGAEQVGFEGAGPAAAPTVRRPGWGYLQHAPGTIVIYETAEVHDCIEQLLKDLRATLKVQVHVDLRILRISTDFLREVGFRWDDLILDGEAFSGPFHQLQGFGMGSPGYGGIAPYVTPPVFDAIFVPEPDDPTEGEFVEVISYPRLWVTHPWSGPEYEIDEDTGVITWEKDTALLPPGAPFMGTGIPFFGDQGTGVNLDFGWGSDSFNLSGFFRLAHERNAARTLSAPQIMLTNGQQGYIVNSTESDYVSTYDVEDNVLVPEVETATAAISLTVRPVVSDDLRYVFLELAPSISLVDLSQRIDFATFVGQPGGEGGAAGAAVTNFITLPIVDTEELATTVGVPDRGVIVVGGLAEAVREQHEGGVPILDKIPLLKRLFSAEGEKLDRSTRFFMASPQIIVLSEEEQRVRP
ncbi:MAG: hypothetical protein PVJ27_02265 [Candidatus Brocadiaceae bacterium]